MTDIRNLPMVEISLGELADMMELEAAEIIKTVGLTEVAVADLQSASAIRDALALDVADPKGSA